MELKSSAASRTPTTSWRSSCPRPSWTTRSQKRPSRASSRSRARRASLDPRSAAKFYDGCCILVSFLIFVLLWSVKVCESFHKKFQIKIVPSGSTPYLASNPKQLFLEFNPLKILLATLTAPCRF